MNAEEGIQRRARTGRATGRGTECSRERDGTGRDASVLRDERVGHVAPETRDHGIDSLFRVIRL